jgi:hypothetical protein
MRGQALLKISIYIYIILQSSNLGGNPKPDACKIVHRRIKWRAGEKKSHIVSKVGNVDNHLDAWWDISPSSEVIILLENGVNIQKYFRHFKV